MEREVLITGIGGQGVQLAAQVLARARDARGPRRDVLRPLRRHDARRQHRQHRRGRRRADRRRRRSCRTRGRRSRCTTSSGSRSSRSCGPAALVLVNDATFTHEITRAGHRACACRPPSVAAELGNPLGGVDGDGRRVRRDHRPRRARRARRGDARVDPVVPHAAHRGERARARAPAATSCPPNAHPAWERSAAHA